MTTEQQPEPLGQDLDEILSNITEDFPESDDEILLRWSAAKVLAAEIDRLRTALAEAGPRWRADIRITLSEHWLVGVDCDEEQHRDRARCACSRLDLGWQENVGMAVASWIDHLLKALPIRGDA